MANQAAQNQARANQIAAASIGETADELSSDVFGAAATRLGEVFESTVTGQTVKLDKPFRQSIAQARREVRQAWGGGAGGKRAQKVLKDARDAAKTGSLTGEQYAHITSQLGKMARQQLRGENSNPDAAFAIFKVKEALDDAMARSLGGEARQAFGVAREQYRNLMNLEAGNVVSISGDVNLASLAKQLRRRDRKGFTQGRNRSDLYEAARVGGTFFPKGYGNPGTAQRGSLIPPMLAAAAGATVDPTTAIIAGTGTYLAPWAAARGYTGANRLLTNQLMNPARRELAGGLLGRIGAANSPSFPSGLLGPSQ